MKNMKSILLKILKSLSSQQGSSMTIKMRTKYHSAYWTAHPNMYVSIWMKADFHKMDIIDFLSKYMVEMEDDGTSESRRKDIESVILPMYREITGINYDTNLFAAYGINQAI